MAQIDFTATTPQYDTMMVTFDGVRAKLAANKDVLTRILAMENGQDKVKAFALTDDGKWLLEVNKVRNDLNKYFEDVRWEDA